MPEPTPGSSLSPADPHLSPGDLAVPEFIASLLVEGDDDLAAWALGQAIGERSRAAVFDRVVGPAMELVGSRWSTGDWSISQEHLASVALRDALARLRPGDAAITRIGPTAVLAAPAGEHHVAGLACLAQVLEEHGWHVETLGANVPADDFAVYVAARDVDLVCLSIGLTAHLPALRRTLEALEAALADRPERPAVMVGGHGVDGSASLDIVDFAGTSLMDAERFVVALARRRDRTAT
jgi:methanogenic corrinoid protein MtbC1